MTLSPALRTNSDEKKRKKKKKKPLLGVFPELPVKSVNMCSWKKVWGLIEMLRLATASVCQSGGATAEAY